MKQSPQGVFLTVRFRVGRFSTPPPPIEYFDSSSGDFIYLEVVTWFENIPNILNKSSQYLEYICQWNLGKFTKRSDHSRNAIIDVIFSILIWDIIHCCALRVSLALTNSSTFHMVFTKSKLNGYLWLFTFKSITRTDFTWYIHYPTIERPLIWVKSTRREFYGTILFCLKALNWSAWYRMNV